MVETQHIRRGGIVGPVILIGAGIVFLLTNLGVVSLSVWGVLLQLWPVLLIAIGLDILIGRRSVWGSLLVAVLLLGVLGVAVWLSSTSAFPGEALTSEQVSQPLNGAARATVEISPGIAELRIDGLAEGAGLIEGRVNVGEGERVVQNQSQSGDTLQYTLRGEGTGWLWPARWYAPDGSGRLWDLHLNRDVPMQLKLDTGVGRSEVDLSRVKVTTLDINNGIGQTRVTLPRQGQVTASIDGGIGEMTVVIPVGVGARIRVNGGLGSTEVKGNFSHQGNTYTTPDFSTATDRVDVSINGGIGRVLVQQVNEG